MSSGSLEVRHDTQHDIYFVTPHWRIETLDDCVRWREQYEARFGPIGRQVDVILALGDFHIGKGIGPVWGRFRADMVRRHFRFSVRIDADAKVATFVATSGAIHQAAHDVAPDALSAIGLIKRLRANLP
jgi:hypothetical protein